ncbi:glycosyltransferase [Enterococcus sp. AZ192]|uniref:glycosyltransferase n=1 Tax=unclassified Enterococcus TaxID=2608891 RepID=UPI003D27E2FD
MRLSILPFEIESNKYIELMKTSYEICNVSVVEDIQESDIISLNWFENIDSKYFIKKLFIYLKKTGLLFLWRKKKIVWTMHNKQPHNSKKNFFSDHLIRNIIKKSDKIIIHSKDSIDQLTGIYNLTELEKVVYVPHPNYIDQYGELTLKKNLDNKKLKLLFVGAIKEYKNIELLVGVFNELNFKHMELSICGRPSSDNYKKKLEKLISNNQKIKTEFKFIDDEELPLLLEECHILVTPYELKSSLNSGTIILSFSYARTVLSPTIGTLKDIKDRSIFFTYEYDSEQEHYECLKEKITFIYEEYSGRYDDLLMLGEKCREYVQESNSLDNTAKELMRIIY